MRVIERYPAAMRTLQGSGAWAILTPLRMLASVMYGAAIGFHRRLCGRPIPLAGIPTLVRGPLPRVVSVGNLVLGGVGKTPCTIELARLIAERGGSPVVVMRGYGSYVSKRRLTPFIVAARPPSEDPSGVRFLRPGDARASDQHGDPLLDESRLASMIGDEAVLYRRRGIPVVIDGDRIRGAQAALRLLGPTHVLLDDGFQNRRLRKDVEILLLDAASPFGNGRLLPAGTLREPATAVRRADVVIVTRAVDDTLPDEVGGLIGSTPVFFGRHVPAHVVRREGSSVPPSWLADKRVALFSGIARHESFEELVRQSGAARVVSFRFIDHHAYREEEIERMLGEVPSDVLFLTTEKDWVKSKHLFPREREICALTVRFEIKDAHRLLALF